MCLANPNFFPKSEIDKVQTGHAPYWESPASAHGKIEEQQTKEPCGNSHAKKCHKCQQLVAPGILVDSRMNPNGYGNNPSKDCRDTGQQQAVENALSDNPGYRSMPEK